MILRNKNKQIKLREHLFWDIPKEKIDLEKTRRLIIKRVLSRGNKFELVQVYIYYGIDVIKETISNATDLDPRTINFANKSFQFNP